MYLIDLEKEGGNNDTWYLVYYMNMRYELARTRSANSYAAQVTTLKSGNPCTTSQNPNTHGVRDKRRRPRQPAAADVPAKHTQMPSQKLTSYQPWGHQEGRRSSQATETQDAPPKHNHGAHKIMDMYSSLHSPHTNDACTAPDDRKPLEKTPPPC